MKGGTFGVLIPIYLHIHTYAPYLAPLSHSAHLAPERRECRDAVPKVWQSVCGIGQLPHSALTPTQPIPQDTRRKKHLCICTYSSAELAEHYRGPGVNTTEELLVRIKRPGPLKQLV